MSDDILTQIQPKHLEGKPKIIGKIDGQDMFQLKTKGGLYIITKAKGKNFEMISCGPHPAVARAIVNKKYDKVEFTSLSKADHVDEAHYALLLPEYETITERLRDLNGDNS